MAPRDRSEIGAEVLEETFLGEPARLTRDEILQKADVQLEQGRRLWRALGFVDAEPGQPMFTQADLEALRLAIRLQQDQFVGDGVAESLARVIGQTMSRLSEALVEALSDVMADDEALMRMAAEKPDEAVRSALERTAYLLPDMEWLVTYVWRRHLLAATQRAMGGAAADLPDEPVAVGFCDIVGYTSLTRDMTRTDLAKLVETFESNASDIVVRSDGRIVKTLGDEVMFVTDNPTVAGRIGLDLVEQFCAEDNPVPGVRVGIAWGPALLHAGDVFGPVVNLASRCTGIARPNSVTCDREIARMLREEKEFEVSKLRTFRVRGYSHLTPYVIRRAR